MQEIEGDNILKTDTWLRFLWQPRTQTADKQTIIPQRERGRITNVRDDKDPISSPDGTKAGRSQHWCHLSLQGPVRFSIRQSSCTRGWHATQASLMESRTKKKIWCGGVNEWRSWPIWAQLETVSSGPAAVTECSHRHGQQRWEMGKMSKQFMDMQRVKAKPWMNYTTHRNKQEARLI